MIRNQLTSQYTVIVGSREVLFCPGGAIRNFYPSIEFERTPEISS